MEPNPGKSKVIVNITRETIYDLFKDLPMMLAKITQYSLRPSPVSSSLDIRIKFFYKSGFDKNYDNQQDVLQFNASKMGDILRDFKLDDIRNLPGRDIYVFTKYSTDRNKRIIFGIIPFELYTANMFNV